MLIHPARCRHDIPFSAPPTGLFAFSATCYYFAESLAAKMAGDVPLGMIHTAWGGSMIEQWARDSVTVGCGGMMRPKPGFTQTYWDTRVVPYLDMVRL